MCLLQGRGSRRLRVLQERVSAGALCRVVERLQVLLRLACQRVERILYKHGQPQRRTAEQQAAQTCAVVHVMVGRPELGQQPRRPAPEGERQQVQAGTPGDDNLIEEENNQGRGTNNTGTL